MKVIQADIATLEVDAIVNAAKNSLLGGGGVDGAIHRAAGPGLLKECAGLGGCHTGEAKITKGYNLPARFVIHTVGPVWHDGSSSEESKLASCYKCCIRLAVEHNLKTIAFPSISTGVYGYPIAKAAKTAVKTVQETLEEISADIEVIFCCFSQQDLEVYSGALRDIGETSDAIA